MSAGHRWALLPAIGAPLVHGPVMALDAFGALKQPLDGGATVRGRRLFGDNKTWRGALFMTAGPVAASVVLRRSAAYRARLPREVQDAPPALVGGLLGAAVMVGELPNSFAKRQLGIAAGTQRGGPVGVALSVFDQADWVPTAWLLLAPVWRMTAREAAEAFVLVAALHVPVNLIGFAIGARSSKV